MNKEIHFYLLFFIGFFAVLLQGCGAETGGDGGPVFEVQKISSSDIQAGEQMGVSVAIIPEYILVGSDLKNGGPGGSISKTGAAYVYRRAGPNIWGEETKIVAPDAQADDRFGFSVSMRGVYAAVGAFQEDGGTGDPLLDAGGAYVFQRLDQTLWDKGVKLTAPDAQPEDQFGYSVSISGDYVVVGAPQEDGGAGDTLDAAGAAYIFKRTDTNRWDSVAKKTAYDAKERDFFGQAVSIDGDYVIVGADLQDEVKGEPLTNAGAAYIFHRTGENTWDGGTKITSPEPKIFERFGFSVSIYKDHAIVGIGSSPGGAYIFRRTGPKTWDLGVKVIGFDAQPGDLFGHSVSIHGDFALVGAPAYKVSNNRGRLVGVGAAYLFRRSGPNVWERGPRYMASDGREDDGLAWSVSLMDGNALLGAKGVNGDIDRLLNDSGAVYLYEGF